jgi:hypothetical protein
VHGVNDVSHTEIHTIESLVPEPSGFEIKLATEKLRIHISTGIDHIPTELFKAGDLTIRDKITLVNKLYPLCPTNFNR